MSRPVPTLKKQRYSDSDMTSLAQDVQQTMRSSIVPVEIRVFEGLYKEPLVIGQLDVEPSGIELIRVLNLFSPMTPVQCGPLCHFIYVASKASASITSIDGLSPTIHAQIQFRFTFRITYPTV